MNNQQANRWERQFSGNDMASSLARAETRERRRSVSWRSRVRAVARPVVLSAASFLLLLGVINVPLPAQAASLGSGWAEHIQTAAGGPVGNTITLGQYATTRIGFSGTLKPSIGRAGVTIVVQKVSGATTTLGTMTTLARRVFNTQPATLPSLFATMGVTARPNTTYRIAVNSGGGTLTSATITLAR